MEAGPPPPAADPGPELGGMDMGFIIATILAAVAGAALLAYAVAKLILQET